MIPSYTTQTDNVDVSVNNNAFKGGNFLYRKHLYLGPKTH